MPRIIGGSLAEHRGQVRERLFDALLRLLGERGYDTISLADIAASAGVGRTAVYNHFPDKESVLLALVEHQAGEYVQRLRSALAALSNPVDQLALFVLMQLIELAGAHVHVAGLRAALSEPGRAQIAAHAAPLGGIVKDVLRAGMAQRYLPEQDLDALVSLVSTVAAGRTTTNLPGRRLQRAIDSAVLFVLRGVGARIGPGRRPRRLPGTPG